MNYNRPAVLRLSQQGFTLLELMGAMIIVASLSVLAMSSYQKQMKESYQNAAKTELLGLRTQLGEWRAKTLTFGGFVPVQGYGESDKITIYSPAGANAGNYKYKITLTDGETGNLSLTDVAAVGLNWKMTAVPNRDVGVVSNADSFFMDSQGQRCQVTDESSLGSCQYGVAW